MCMRDRERKTYKRKFGNSKKKIGLYLEEKKWRYISCQDRKIWLKAKAGREEVKHFLIQLI